MSSEGVRAVRIKGFLDHLLGEKSVSLFSHRFHISVTFDIIILYAVSECRAICSIAFTYGKLSNLCFIDAHDFVQIVGAETKYRQYQCETINTEQDDNGHRERVGASSDRVRELDAELAIVVIDPTPRNDCIAIEMRNIVTDTG